MVDTRKVLGQIAPSANTETALYTCSTNANVNITITNRGKVSTTFTLRIAVADAAVANKQYIAKDHVIEANEVLEFNDLEVAATDVIYVTPANDQLTAQAFGLEA